jgi:DNA-binding LacI/PurR family transcriptional regulator
MINTASKTPKYLQVVQALRKRLSRGEYDKDMQLPPVRTLGTQLGVSRNAVHRALQVLAKEGIIETQRGVGIRVAAEVCKKTPLTFGFIYPFNPNEPFAGRIHIVAEKAINLQSNHYVIRSSFGNPAEERLAAEQCLEGGCEGLILWPCPGEENREFFQALSTRVPLVYIDRIFEGSCQPSVILDWARMGRDVVFDLGQRGFSRILVLEEQLEISSYRELYRSIRETVRKMGIEDRFRIAPMTMYDFYALYARNPNLAVESYAAKLDSLLGKDRYDALFTPQDEFLDYVFISTELAATYPALKLFSVTDTTPMRRSPGFYRRGIYEWVTNTEAMVRKATEILHNKVYFRSRAQQPIRIPCRLIHRTADSLCWEAGGRK